VSGSVAVMRKSIKIDDSIRFVWPNRSYNFLFCATIRVTCRVSANIDSKLTNDFPERSREISSVRQLRQTSEICADKTFLIGFHFHGFWASSALVKSNTTAK